MIDNDILELVDFIAMRNSDALEFINMQVRSMIDSLERIDADKIYRAEFYRDLLNPRLIGLIEQLNLRDDFLVAKMHQLKRMLNDER